jgi:anaerobic magnesium-protoporphyrin IX monomethyl ester cyclase
MKGILLTTLNAKYIHMNLAIRLLYELNKSDERLSWKEFAIKEDLDLIASHCAEYEVVCFSCYIWNIRPTLKVIEKIKAINPATRIMLGGPEVSYDWLELMQRDEIDYIITGEGEIPFSEFLKSYPEVYRINNLASKKNGEIIYQQYSMNFELDQYADTNAYANEEPSSLQNRIAYIETSRGCPYKCEFCLASLDNRVRYLPMDYIKSNLLYLMQHGKVIKFLDRTFNVKKDFTLEIFRFILDHARPENVFQFEITADILHPEIMAFINEKVPKGMFRFEIGIQTVNQKANLEVSRKQNFDKTKGVILNLRDHVDMHLDLIVGLPLDRWNDIKFSFEEVFKLFAPELQLGFLKFLKGTPVREKYLDHGYVFDEEAPYQIIRSNYLSEQELYDITLLEHALEIYWNKPRLINTLKYVTQQYSIFDFLLGLGKYFEKVHGQFIGYSLEKVYDIAADYIQSAYPQDKMMIELLAIDHWTHHRIKPAKSYIPEWEKKEKFALLNRMYLPHNKYRYVVTETSFDCEILLQQNITIMERKILVLEYNGVEKPKFR